jgi:hypothetical protein
MSFEKINGNKYLQWYKLSTKLTTFNKCLYIVIVFEKFITKIQQQKKDRL